MSTEPIRQLDRMLREIYTDDVVDATAYGLSNAPRQFEAQARPFRYEPQWEPSTTYRWQVPDENTDSFESRVRYWATPMQPTYNAVFTIDGAPTVSPEPPRPAFNNDWIRANYASDYRPERCLAGGIAYCVACAATREGAERKYEEMYGIGQALVSVAVWWDTLHDAWYNIALAHTAAYFMLEVHWTGNQITNEKQIAAYVTTPTDSAESGGDR